MRYHTDVSAGLDFVPGFIIRATDFSAEYAAQGASGKSNASPAAT